MYLASDESSGDCQRMEAIWRCEEYGCAPEIVCAEKASSCQALRLRCFRGLVPFVTLCR